MRSEPSSLCEDGTLFSWSHAYKLVMRSTSHWNRGESSIYLIIFNLIEERERGNIITPCIIIAAQSVCCKYGYPLKFVTPFACYCKC